MKFNTLTRILSAIGIAFIFWFVDTYCVKALNNIGPLSGLTISENGRFNDHRSNGSSSIGYQINNFGEYYSASPTSSTQLTHNGYGASIVQCDMSFAKGNYYSVSYYFLDDSMSFYFHPYYTSMSNKLAIGDTTSLSSTNFTYETVNSDVQRKLVEGLGYISSYTIIFKAPQTGTCLLSAFSSSPSGPSDALSFVGYTYKSLGTKELSASDIQNALSSSFTSISNKIDQSINAATGSIIGSITNGNDSINSNIDELKEKQEEAHETSKGIWGTLKSLVSSIGNWFTDLMSSIGDGFKNLIEGIKALFVGEEVEECKVIKNNFTTYTHWIDDTSLSVPNYYARPVDSDGYIQLYYNSNLYRISDNFSPIKPNTEYTLYVESSPSNSLGSFIFYPSKYNTSNSKNKYRFPSMNTNKTLAPGESAIFYITSNSEDDVNYSLSSMFAYTDTDKQQGGSLYARIMLLEGHYTESEIKEKGYFKTEKEICEITNKGGLFGIIKDLGSSIVKWFNNLFDFFNNDSIDDSSSFFDGFDTNDNGGISAVITAPLVLVRKSTQSCEPLVLTSFDKDITLPCGDTLFWGRSEVASFRTVWNLLIGGSFLFFLLSKVFKTIENIKDPESDKVEVMKL